ncbi:MAG: bifunctional UDP-N-acetylglucosamine diphosphorylase/glucosamine-1-phosphate N-acetyltransferase GlmU [Vulcanimicrobiaceae bacterium]
MSAHVRAVVLAAGKGTRMLSVRPKVLHELCGRPMLWFVLRALHEAGVDDVTVVTNADVAPHVEAIAGSAGHASARAVLQEPQLGTGHAVQIALAALEPRDGTLLVLNGDMPLVEVDLVRSAMARAGHALCLVTARMPLPSQFGRIVRRGEHVLRIVEARDADEDELLLDEMNAGLYAYDEGKLRRAVSELTNRNSQNEYYLTDTIGNFTSGGETIVPVVASDFRSVLGVNDRNELAAAEAILRARLCEAYMRDGVTLVDPSSTYLEPGLSIAADVTILPNTQIGRGTTIGAHSEIGPNVRLAGARIGEHVVVCESVIVDSAIADFAVVGPYAHVRGGAEIGTGARVGNFVEVKKSTLAAGVKANHLAYIGDATIGERTNIGAGTITANYDGTTKHPTTIGRDVSIGSNSTLVAPVTIGDRALTGAGAVVTRDVAAGDRVVGNPAKPLPKSNASSTLP